MNPKIFIFICVSGLLAAASCSTTRSLAEGEYLLRKNTIQTDDPAFNVSGLSSYIAHKPNSYFLGVNPLLSVYNWSGDGSTPFKRFLRKIGSEPIVYDSTKVEMSVTNIASHLNYIGYYGSEVSSKVDVIKKKAYVTYLIKLGNRYKISDIDYEIPTYGTFQEEFLKDLPNSTVHEGQFLSEEALEKEADRSSAYFRSLGYFGFTKSFYAFEADTLSHDGQAKLHFAIRDYALGDAPSSAKEHKKFTLSEVNISHPEKLKIRPSVLENLNILRPGQLYNEKEVNTNYSRFSSVGVLTGVNINLEPVSEDQVECNISLRNSGLQGFKTNLEASFNSTGLFGISPQLTYYHRNIFHGGEELNLGVKGNFQFRPKSSAYSTEVSVSTTLRFPSFIGLPNRIFKGPNIPHTDITAAFNYQDRPEFRRSVISTAFTYNGRIKQNIFYKFSPIRANLTHMYYMDEDFMMKLLETNPFVYSSYMDHVDLGVGGTLYYTTDASSVPMTPYHYVRLGLDVSGNVVSLFNRWLPTLSEEDPKHTIWDTPYAQYVRADINLGKVFRFGKEDRHAIALHFQTGIAYGYGNSDSAPVEQLFYAGGAMSMRGWQARTLGPGTSQESYGFSIPSQVGEMKIEANVEYRFPLISKLEGALFVDAGNIWDLSNAIDPSAQFKWSTFPAAIALNWGFGARLNLNFLLVRVDMGIRLRDPSRPEGERWVPTKVGYPF